MNRDDLKREFLKIIVEKLGISFKRDRFSESRYEIERAIKFLRYFWRINPTDFIIIFYAVIDKMLSMNIDMRNVDYNNSDVVDCIELLKLVIKEFVDCKTYENHASWLYVANKFHRKIIDLGYISWIKQYLYEYCIYLIRSGHYREDYCYIKSILEGIKKRKLFKVDEYCYERVVLVTGE